MPTCSETGRASAARRAPSSRTGNSLAIWRLLTRNLRRKQRKECAPCFAAAPGRVAEPLLAERDWRPKNLADKDRPAGRVAGPKLVEPGRPCGPGGRGSGRRLKCGGGYRIWHRWRRRQNPDGGSRRRCWPGGRAVLVRGLHHALQLANRRRRAPLLYLAQNVLPHLACALLVLRFAGGGVAKPACALLRGLLRRNRPCRGRRLGAA